MDLKILVYRGIFWSMIATIAGYYLYDIAGMYVRYAVFTFVIATAYMLSTSKEFPEMQMKIYMLYKKMEEMEYGRNKSK